MRNQDKFLDEHAAVLLSVLRFTPQQYELLTRIGLTAEQIDRAFQFNENYQSAMRTNVRVKDGDVITVRLEDGRSKTVKGEGVVDVWLIDRPSAEDFVADFPAAKGKISQLPKNLVPKAKPPKERMPERPEGYDTWTEAERSKWRSKQFRQSQRAANAHRAQVRERMENRKEEEA